jgi:Rieske Fe-S protein
MDKQSLLSRKSFLRLLTGLGTGFFLWAWYGLGEIGELQESQVEFRHGSDIPLGVSYFGKYYLYRTGEIVLAFSTICTHAGCRIGKAGNTTLRCGCHGSRFEAATGKPIQGPAIYPLQQLDCRFDSNTGQWVVKWQGRKEKNG